jgi:hypothetical protein
VQLHNKGRVEGVEDLVPPWPMGDYARAGHRGGAEAGTRVVVGTHVLFCDDVAFFAFLLHVGFVKHFHCGWQADTGPSGRSSGLPRAASAEATLLAYSWRVSFSVARKTCANRQEGREGGSVFRTTVAPPAWRAKAPHGGVGAFS